MARDFSIMQLPKIVCKNVGEAFDVLVVAQKVFIMILFKIKEQNNKNSDIGLHLCLFMTIYNFVNHLLFPQFRCTGTF